MAGSGMLVLMEIAHAAGALVYVDAVAAAPHFRLDMSSLGADFLALSAYKWCGPHAGAVVASVDLLETLHPDKLEPSSSEVPERFELGTAGLANMAGITAAVDHLADLVAGEGGRRQRLDRSFAALRARGEDHGSGRSRPAHRHARCSNGRGTQSAHGHHLSHGGLPSRRVRSRRGWGAGDLSVEWSHLRVGAHQGAGDPRYRWGDPGQPLAVHR